MSAQSTIPNFGRAWRLTVNTGSQEVTAFSTAWQPEPLHITFEVVQTCTQALWFANICIYNLSNQTLNAVIQQGQTVRLEAGYQTGTYGVIFDGVIYQPMWEREDIVNYKLTLKCFVDLGIGNNFASGTFSSGLTSRQWVAQMAASAITPINILPQDTNSEATLTTTQQSRGGVIHGDPRKYFTQVAKVNGLNTWATQQGQQILALQNPNASVPTISFGVGSGLIGTPQQTQFGMDCKVLLDSRLKPRTAIQLDQQLNIRQLPLVPNPKDGTLPTIINQSGTYTIGGVRHIGDSRGQDWYTEVTAFNGDQLIEALEAYGTYSGHQ